MFAAVEDLNAIPVYLSDSQAGSSASHEWLTGIAIPSAPKRS
jgi:hypothetical protein